MGAWFFLRMREWGLGRVGNFKLGRAPLWEFFIFIFMGKKTAKWPPFCHAAVFQLPSRIGMNKTFFGNQFDIHSWQQQAKLLEVWTIMVFSCPTNCSFSCFLLCIPSIALEVKAWPEGLCSREGNAFLCWVCNCLEIRLDLVWVFIALGLSSLV